MLDNSKSCPVDLQVCEEVMVPRVRTDLSALRDLLECPDLREFPVRPERREQPDLRVWQVLKVTEVQRDHRDHQV